MQNVSQALVLAKLDIQEQPGTFVQVNWSNFSVEYPECGSLLMVLL